MERPRTNCARITIKDHKPNFKTDTNCRLLNPSKVDSGKVSKIFLDRINKATRQALGLNQWTKTLDVTEWFADQIKVRGRKRLTFTQFDIVNFYPSISYELLSKALNHIKTFSKIEGFEFDTIEAARKSLLYDGQKVWVKKNGTVGRPNET